MEYSHASPDPFLPPSDPFLPPSGLRGAPIPICFGIKAAKERGGRLKSIKCFLFLAMASIGLLSGCMDTQNEPSDELALPDRPRLSPSGAYRLVVQEGRDTGPFWRVLVERVSDGQSVATFTPHYYTRHTIYALWSDGEDVAWVYSGDIGTSYMIQNEEGEWQEKNWSRGQEYPPVPTELRRLRPNRFP
jgi:hypothetical protein